MAELVLVDAGGANIGSVLYALDRLGLGAELSADPERIRRASHVILPGVGAAAQGMARLRQHGLDRLIPELRQPVLGVCLGMQLLFEHSEEGDVACLGVLRGRVARLAAAPGLRVPHMGWNRVQTRVAHPLLAGLEDPAWAYFVHGYAVRSSPDMIASSRFGGEFVAVAARGNFHGAQFHPERSATVGARLLENFVKL